MIVVKIKINVIFGYFLMITFEFNLYG